MNLIVGKLYKIYFPNGGQFFDGTVPISLTNEKEFSTVFMFLGYGQTLLTAYDSYIVIKGLVVDKIGYLAISSSNILPNIIVEV